MFKKILISMLLVLTLGSSIILNAFNLIPVKKADNSGNVLYRGTQLEVQIPDKYTLDADFRAVWVSHLVADFPSYSGVDQYKAEIKKVLDTMEYFNMNAIIFHIRTHNNALYKSSLNPVSSYYASVNFSVFDPLAYFIQESHKRGIEFHAWLNPYRLTTNYSGLVEDYAKNQPSYNIASNPEMILKSGSSLILNPGEPAVRTFLVDTVMEVIRNYDVDAIHFDDYFYISGVDDTVTRTKYNTNNLPTDDFRRLQIDLFIEQLSTTMRAYNKANNRVVQLGISPSGIYRNGSYVPLSNYTYNANGDLTYPLYSNTNGFAHYGDYLYSNTKKWIDNEWIEYIIPQSYWAFEHPSAAFADVMDWWAQVVKNKKVNLYSGMGLYMAIESSTTYSWKTNLSEALNQVNYCTKYPEIQGHSIFSYKHIRTAYTQTSGLLHENMKRVKNDAWNSKALLPQIRTYDSVKLNGANDLVLTKSTNGFTLNFSSIANAKSYVLYRSTSPVTFSQSEIINILGESTNQVITYDDVVNDGTYYYGIKVMSKTNTLSDGVSLSTDSLKYQVVFKNYDGTILKREAVDLNQSATAPASPSRIGYTFIGWDADYSQITGNLEVNALFQINKYTVTFMDADTVLSTVEVNHGDNVTIDNPIKVGYTFNGWNHDLKNITADTIITARFLRIAYLVNFIGRNGEVISSQTVFHGDNSVVPDVNDPAFIGWDKDTTNITADTTINARYKEIYTLTFMVDGETVLFVEDSESEFTVPQIPLKTGYDQVAPVWSITDFTNINENLVIEAIYTINVYKVTFLGKDEEILKEDMVEYLKYAVEPIPPKVDGFKFIKWDRTFDSITEEIVVKAVYVEVTTPPIVNGCANFSIQSAVISLGILLLIIFRRKNNII